MRSDEGSATLLVVAMIGVLSAVLIATAAAVGLVRAQRSAQSAADLAALAAASRLAQGHDACTAAADVATANGARLVTCRVDAVDVRVTVEVDGPRWAGQGVPVRADARAGPARASHLSRSYLPASICPFLSAEGESDVAVG